MELSLVGLLAGSFAVTALARRLGVSAPLVLVVVGLALSFVPGVPDYALDPELILTLVLPPLLYSAALDSSYLRLRANLRAIGMLAVGAVLCTTLAVGLAAWWLVPGLPLASALVLGAVVAPPDAVAATAVGRRLGLPRKVMTILGGESLVNDATALTAFRVAVALAAGAGYGIAEGLGVFVLAAAGGAAIGWALGWLVHRARMALGDGVLESALGLLVPFVGFVVAEEVHASGVLAVVLAGLYLGHRSPQADPVARLQDRAVWQAADTVLEATVFALIGLQLPAVVAGVGPDLGTLTGVGLALVLVALLARVAFVFPTTYLRPLARRRPGWRPVPWTHPAVVSWAGMRGVVSLAAAAGIPLTTMSGAPFPGRAEVLYLTFVVTVGTLLLHGLTLPALIRRLGVQASEDSADALAEAQAQSDAGRAATARLDALDDGDPLHAQAVTELRQRIEARTNAAWERLGGPVRGGGETPSARYRRLRRAMLEAEREVFVRHRDQRRIDDEVFRRVQHELDLEEVTLLRE
ncbi:monovalent cation:H+ antiporter, CPA1 family [Geodermatophilus telluris]|uniref:Monovalent cation:H+ antiporter, CPA1 family n=1 Tax=Geodermatophilus telluris TaxID=1190417 RepID=A0A1G6PJN9_9ACTN|nr:Na+/H+ antiporter [Geodermatophilus telluris]SDC80278.1 monovalent cation:H+ antiporter, CPA1 family [Geodermatophilus telluris]